MSRAAWAAVLLACVACSRSPSAERSGDPVPALRVGLVGAGALTAAGVWLGIVDDPPRVWLHDASGDRSWPVPARIGALTAGARSAEVIVAAAWPEARLPRAEVWWLVDGIEQRHCTWQAPPAERWRAQPRGASAVLRRADGVIVAGVDGSLVAFDASCAATVLHAEPCCEAELPLRLRGDDRGWIAVDPAGRRVHAGGSVGDATACVPKLDRAAVAGDGWRTPLPAEIRDPQMLDWSASCDTVLVASGTGAWVCRAVGCTRAR